jgi:hypothetical protein
VVKRMKRKLIIGSILAVFLIMTTSIGSVMGSETKNTETKESPLWKVRTRQAITEKIGNIIESIRTSFVSGDRAIFVPLFENIRNENRLFSVALTIFTCPLLCCK